MLKIKRALSLFLILSVILALFVASGISCSAAGTGIGLSEHVLNAYYSGWDYVYGGASEGAVDCSGLIYMYAGGNRTSMLSAASVSGSVSGGIPNIHGLGLYQPGHVGVYVGNGMAVDARDYGYGVCYESVYNKSWTDWFKVQGVSYPDTDWEYFSGNYYYYENGEYLTDTYITVDGISYYLDASGACTTTPGDTGAVADTDADSTDETVTEQSTVMKLGTSGDNVVKLQTRLAELGFFNDDITGYFGSVTESAYIEFQTAAGVYVDGIAGESDLEILYSDYAPYAPVEDEFTDNSSDEYTEEITDDTNTDENAVEDEPVVEETQPETEPTTFENGDYHDGVYEIQSELADLGYFNDDATGYYGDMTQAAVVNFQNQNGLEPTGEVDELTYATLFSSTALENPYTEDSANDAETLTPPAKDSEDTTTATEATDANSDKVNQAVTTPSAASEEVTLKSAELAAKALEGIEFESAKEEDSSSRTGSFIIWLIVMVVFMSAAFWLVYTNEKKKKKARYERIKARANRSW